MIDAWIVSFFTECYVEFPIVTILLNRVDNSITTCYHWFIIVLQECFVQCCYIDWAVDSRIQTIRFQCSYTYRTYQPFFFNNGIQQFFSDLRLHIASKVTQFNSFQSVCHWVAHGYVIDRDELCIGLCIGFVLLICNVPFLICIQLTTVFVLHPFTSQILCQLGLQQSKLAFRTSQIENGVAENTLTCTFLRSYLLYMVFNLLADGSRLCGIVRTQYDQCQRLLFRNITGRIYQYSKLTVSIDLAIQAFQYFGLYIVGRNFWLGTIN